MRKHATYTIFDNITPVAVTSSTDATPIVITATAHGFATGDLVMIQGHTTNIAANGIFKVTRVSSSTFSLQDRYTGANVAGSGAGAGSSGICFPAPKIALCTDFTNFEIQVLTSGSATTTIKVATSLGVAPSSITTNYGTDTPNFGATASSSNPYTFAQIVDAQNNSAINGSTGIVVAGTDILNSYEVNINATKYLTVFPISWTAGSITIKLNIYSI